MVQDFTIRNFRCFEELTLPKLARVNLIVGKNNVGKTALLEALRIYAANGAEEVLWDSVSGRGEQLNKRGRAALASLFFNNLAGQSIYLGPVGDTLEIKFEANTSKDILAPPEVLSVISKGFTVQRILPFYPKTSYLVPLPHRVSCQLVGANGITQESQSQHWDGIALSPAEPDVVESLRLIAPAVRQISLIGNRDDTGRSPFVRLEGLDTPVPLRRLGDGAGRMFGLSLALVSAKGGLLLVDEIENGIHYSVQEKIWRFIFEVSRRLNVQVFATTHSLDCLRAFQEASVDEPEAGLVTRLKNRSGKIVATQFSREDLEIATREQLEIR